MPQMNRYLPPRQWRIPPVVYWHIDPLVRSPTKCEYPPGKCKFGNGNQHFLRESDARVAAEAKLATWAEFMRNTKVPQDPGYFTEYVFFPNDEQTKLDAIALLGPYEPSLAEGTRLVMENGWVLELTTPGQNYKFWRLLQTDEAIYKSSWPVREIGDTLNVLDLHGKLVRCGGRLEVPHGTTPINIKWRDEPGGRF